MRLAAIALVVLTLGSGVALAKTFPPGQLSVCGSDRCVPVESQDVLDGFTRFYFMTPGPSRVRAPRPGSPALWIRTRAYGVTSIVGGRRLDRMLVNGVNCSRFEVRGRWYRLPPVARAEVQRLAAELERGKVPRRWRHRC